MAFFKYVYLYLFYFTPQNPLGLGVCVGVLGGGGGDIVRGTVCNAFSWYGVDRCVNSRSQRVSSDLNNISACLGANEPLTHPQILPSLSFSLKHSLHLRWLGGSVLRALDSSFIHSFIHSFHYCQQMSKRIRRHIWLKVSNNIKNKYTSGVHAYIEQFANNNKVQCNTLI